MKIVIRTEASSTGQETVFVHSFGWCIKSQRILMVHGVGDGFYHIPVETTVIPEEIWHQDDYVLVYVHRPQDIAVLASDLRRDDQSARDSFLHMRT